MSQISYSPHGQGGCVSGAVFKYDLSLPLDAISPLLDALRVRLKDSDCLVAGFGHLGDGNLHLAISTRHSAHSPEIRSKIEPFVFEWTAKQGGSISAEHGLGLKLPDNIWYSKSTSAVEWMRRMKRLFDPKGILNPYKVLSLREQ